MKNRIKGRSAEQQAVIRYFKNEPSCLSKKPINDEEYDQLLKETLKSKDFVEMALNFIGIDSEEVKDVDPIHFEGYSFDDGALQKKGIDKVWRSSKYQTTWIFFGKNQIFIYQYTFFMDEDGFKQKAEDYFYPDVTSISISSDREDIEAKDKNGNKLKVNVDYSVLTIRIVDGQKFDILVPTNDYTDRAIRGMKSLLREKRNS
ncbi:MAG: hypothetical protein IKU85_04970 [Bacteroidaceae bacterium]|nr:hypothetical protein [Bacteroidaceae bacterium]